MGVLGCAFGRRGLPMMRAYLLLLLLLQGGVAVFGMGEAPVAHTNGLDTTPTVRGWPKTDKLRGNANSHAVMSSNDDKIPLNSGVVHGKTNMPGARAYYGSKPGEAEYTAVADPKNPNDVTYVRNQNVPSRNGGSFVANAGTGGAIATSADKTITKPRSSGKPTGKSAVKAPAPYGGPLR